MDDDGDNDDKADMTFFWIFNSGKFVFSGSTEGAEGLRGLVDVTVSKLLLHPQLFLDYSTNLVRNTTSHLVPY